MKKVFLVILIILWATNAYSACVADGANWASTPDQVSVKSCYDQADSEDTITISAGDGTETWSTGYTCGNRTAMLCATKAVKLVGPGSGNLTITVGNTAYYLIIYEPATYTSDKAFEISGFTFNANGGRILRLGDGNTHTGMVLQTKTKIFDNVFIDTAGVGQTGGAIISTGSLYGLIYNNTFGSATYRWWYPTQHGNGGYVDIWWEAAPYNEFLVGSAKYMYWEDNTFYLTCQTPGSCSASNGPVVTHCQYSGRYVYRYNTFNSNAYGTLFDVHGQQSNTVGGMASCFGSELYGNDITSTVNSNMIVHTIRSSSGQNIAMYNNVNTTGTPRNQAYTTSGGIDKCPSAYADLKITRAYWFGNRKNYTGAVFADSVTGSLECLGYTGIPSLSQDVFTESSSVPVTCGALASLPATCTIGQGYWATDQSCVDLTDYVGTTPTTPIAGTLYKCTANNVWAAYYTPYTYPHTLRTGEAPADVTAPTFFSSSIDATGEILTVRLSEDVAIADNTGFVLTCSGGAAGLTFTSESNGTLLYAIDRPIQQAEGHCSLAYTSVANGIQDAAGNDLASFGGGDEVVVNGSGEVTPPTVALTLTVTGTGCHIVSSPSGINSKVSTSASYDSGTAVTLAGWYDNGWESVTFGGHCASNGTVTMDGAKTCTATCNAIPRLPWAQ